VSPRRVEQLMKRLLAAMAAAWLCGLVSLYVLAW
jgi:hypothetical protein